MVPLACTHSAKPEAQDPGMLSLGSGEEVHLWRFLWHALTADIWVPIVHTTLLTDGVRWCFQASYSWQSSLCKGLGVVPKVSLEIGVVALRASTASPCRMVWSPHQSHTSLGMPVMVAGAPRLGKSNLQGPGTLATFNCPSFTPLHSTNVHSHPSPFFTLSHFLPPHHPISTMLSSWF